MATPVLNPKITTAGLALMPTNNGAAVALTHIAIGTGLYPLDANAGARVALVNEVARFPISSGTNPTPTSVQIGVTITDIDPGGKSPNGKSIGEIGFYAGNTLWAVWSQAGTPLFVKSEKFDVPFAYTFDISDFPRDSVTVQVTTDVPGMTALINQHEAKADPHTQYVGKLRGMGEYDATFNYMKGAHISYPVDGKTYRSLVDNNKGAAPSSNSTKWERWGFSIQELTDEFVPPRTSIQSGVGVLGILRLTNPEGLAFAASGSATGAIKVNFPTNAGNRDTFVKLRLEVFELAARRSMSILLSGHFNTSLVWDGASAAVLGDLADRNLAVRFGSEGARPCIWIGDANSAWTYPRVYAPELMVSQNGDGGDRNFWMKGWGVTIGDIGGAVGATVAPSLVFGRTDIPNVEGLEALLATKQGGLGYVPVQQGGGIGQGTNKVYMGWNAGGLKVTVDSTDLGFLAFRDSPAFTGVPTVPTPAAGLENLQIANTAFVTGAIRQAQLGQISLEPRVNPRAGYLLCNGAELSRTTYAALWAVVQTGGVIFQESDWKAAYWGGFGYGPGGTNGTTFRIPELRGEFLRCHDFARGRDSGRPWPGHFQAGQNVSHAHGGAVAAVGDHVHSAWTDVVGWHGHDGATSAAGGHNHNNGGFSRLLRPPYGGSLTGNDSNGSGSEQAVGTGDSADIVWVGDHAHGFATNGNGNHGHGVGIGGAGNHAHGLSIYADGGNEPRPHNVSIGAFIRVI